MPSTTISDNVEIDVVFEFPQDFSDITFSSENPPNNLVFNIEESTSVGLEVLTQGLEGAKGDKGDKGDKLLYSDLSLLEKQEIASLVELDTGVLTTDLLANYILNKE